MKHIQQKSFWVITSIVLLIGYMVSCTRDDQITIPTTPVNNATDLISLKVSTPPTIDGIVDPMWENSSKLQFSTTVPEVTGDVFRGYTGNIIPTVTLRSAYDNNNIYFLAEWADPTQSLKRGLWYYNPTTQRWAQEKGSYDFDPLTNGGSTRLPFYEDKAAFLWNINNSVSGWNNGTCYKSCHTGLPQADGYSRHFTNFSTEKIDMWHWKSVRGGVNAGFQFHDQFQDNSYPNGRKGDGANSEEIKSNDVYTDNKQNLTITGTSTTYSVPKYVVPGRNDYYWIMNSEITAGTAKLVTEVSATGVLTLSDGSTIDPNVGTDFQRVGSGVGSKAIPGIYLKDAGYGNSAGDISCKAVYTAGKGWALEFKRALKTADTVNDIDFSSLADQYFGFAIFENAQIAHSIKANLVLKFKK